VNRVAGEERLCLFVGDTWVNDDIVAPVPIDGRSDAVLVADLESCNPLSVSNLQKNETR